MKQYFLLTISMLFLLTGCGSKSSSSVDFDGFTFKLYDNNKYYKTISGDVSNMGIKILAEMVEQDTGFKVGFINSLVVSQIVVMSGMDIESFVDANTKQLQIKLLKYTSIESKNKNVICDDRQYSGYIITFSYQVDDQILYGGQLFFIAGELLYTISLSSDDPKDIKKFIKSIVTLKCN